MLKASAKRRSGKPILQRQRWQTGRGDYAKWCMFWLRWSPAMFGYRVHHDFFRRLSEGQSGIVSHKGGGPLNLWVRLANAAGNHNGWSRRSRISLPKLPGCGGPPPPERLTWPPFCGPRPGFMTVADLLPKLQPLLKCRRPPTGPPSRHLRVARDRAGRAGIASRRRPERHPW